MKIIGSTTLAEIEEHLKRLGGGNQADNMASLRKFSSFWRVRLEEKEFLGLVFLQNSEVARIARRERIGRFARFHDVPSRLKKGDSAAIGI